MMQRIKFLALKGNWHTYAAVLAGLGLGGLDALHDNGYLLTAHAPHWLQTVFIFLGIAGVRYGMSKDQTLARGALDGLFNLVAQVSSQITEKDVTIPSDATGATIVDRPVEEVELSDITPQKKGIL